jgi:hypothetical protein
MKLNIPILDELAACKNLLIAGMGGGFDIFCGLPIYFELAKRGQTVHLANYSFSGIKGLSEGGTVRLSEGLVGITANYEHRVMGYFPELYVCQWFQEVRGEEIVIWCFDKVGAKPLLENYQLLVEHLSIDGILMIDGGVDSLMRGDEAGVGTLVEDSISLCAVNALEDVPFRAMACLGLGAEQDISYHGVMENIAEFAKAGAFWGSCSLVKQMPAYQDYESVVNYVFAKPGQDSSVINASVVSAVAGEFGDFHLTQKTLGSNLWISPLMPIYWFFDLSTVAEKSYVQSQLGMTEDFRQAWRIIVEIRQMLKLRRPREIPL